MTKFKKRFIKIGIIALMPILALLLCLHNTYAYYLNSDNNIVSNNLANLNNLTNVSAVNKYNYSISNQTLTLTQVGSDNDPHIYFDNFITLNAGTYSMYYLVDTQEVQVMGLTQPSGQNYLIPYQNYTRFTIDTTTSFGLGFEGYGLNGRVFNVKIMIYSEDAQLDYEPFGTWINSNDYLTAYPFNASNWQFLSGQLNGVNLSEFDEVIVFNNSFIDFKLRYLEDYNGYNYNNNSVSVTYISDRLNTFSSFTAISSMSNSDGYSFQFLKDNDIVLTTIDFNEDISNENMNFTYPIEFNKIIIYIETSKFYDTSYVNNFSVNVGTFYQGYQYAKDLLQNDRDQIYNDGYNQGYSQGQSVGYNDGYNEGVSQDIETTGMKTLFNSILSYPVNMIKSVFNFEFMGVNIASIIMFVVSVGIVIFVIKKFKE